MNNALRNLGFRIYKRYRLYDLGFKPTEFVFNTESRSDTDDATEKGFENSIILSSVHPWHSVSSVAPC